MLWHYSKEKSELNVKDIFFCPYSPLCSPIYRFLIVEKKQCWKIVPLIMILRTVLFSVSLVIKIFSCILIVHIFWIFHSFISCLSNCFLISFFYFCSPLMFLFPVYPMNPDQRLSWPVSSKFCFLSLHWNTATSMTTSLHYIFFPSSLDVFPLPTRMFRSPLDQGNLLLIIFLTLLCSFFFLLLPTFSKDYYIIIELWFDLHCSTKIVSLKVINDLSIIKAFVFEPLMVL